MTDPSSPPPSLKHALDAPLAEDRDLDFTLPLNKRIESESRKRLIAAFVWRALIVASVALLIAASTVGGFYLARLGARTIVGG